MEFETSTREKTFIRTFLLTAALVIGSLYIILVLIDPIDVLHMSLPLKRYPVDINQRYTYTPIARSQDFDSLIIGTSTTRMIKPAKLNPALSAKFANLSMNAATWWEQEQMFKLFLKHHEAPRFVIWGIDTIWCQEEEIGPRLTKRAFPGWLYDENPWNNYSQILNFKHLEWAGRLLGVLMGVNQPSYGRDGYASLNKKGTPYDIDRARQHIYGQAAPVPPAPQLQEPAYDETELAQMPFPGIRKLEGLVADLPANTQVLLMMVPYHQHFLGAENGSTMLKYEECKTRVQKLAEQKGRWHYMDFMYRSNFTMNDWNYWDPMHYNEEGAEMIENAIIGYLLNRQPSSPIFRTSQAK